MVRSGEARHPAFSKLRSDLRGPAGRTLPVSAAGAAIAEAVAKRKRTVVAPGFVRAAQVLRGVIGPLTDRDSRRHAAAIDRATAEMVAERGAFDAAMRPDERGAGPTARPLER